MSKLQSTAAWPDRPRGRARRIMTRSHGAIARVLHKLKKCCYCYLAPVSDRGIGVFAARDFARDEPVMADLDGDFFDEVMTLEQMQASAIYDYPLQVGPNAYRVPTGGIEDFTNHSCAPTTGIRQTPAGIVVIALRDIHAHEEITFDYATWLTEPALRFTCMCGATTCRGEVDTFFSLAPALQSHYLEKDVVGWFVQQSIGMRK